MSLHVIVDSIQKEVSELIRDDRKNQYKHIENIKTLCNAYNVVIGHDY